MEIPFFFKNNNYNLFGVLHRPDEHTPTSPLASRPLRDIGIVFCHPFAEEKLISHRFIVNLARGLSKDGMYCLRFDYFGHGDSEGNFEDATIETRISDISKAIHYLKKTTGVKRICLYGIRFGATLAALHARNDQSINFLILIEPIINGNLYIDQCLRSNLTTQMAIFRKINKTRKQLIQDIMSGEMINFEGYLLTKKMYLQIKTIDLLKDSDHCFNNVFIMQVSKKENHTLNKPHKELYRLYLRICKNVEFKIIKDTFYWADSKTYNSNSTKILTSTKDWLHTHY